MLLCKFLCFLKKKSQSFYHLYSEENISLFRFFRYLKTSENSRKLDFDDDKRLPYLYWTLKLHKSPVKHRFIAGSSKCYTKQLSSLLTKILTVIKTGLEKYCGIKTSHTGVNNMWILKNSTNLLLFLSHLGVHGATSTQTFDFSTLCTSIPHDLLNSRMNNIINNAFKHKMELHDTPTSKLAEIKAIPPVIL